MFELAYLISTSISVILVLYIIDWLRRPYNFVHDSKEFKWSLNDHGSRINTGELPPYYPNSWLPVLDSNELTRNQIKTIFIFEKDLIVYRGSSGKCYAFDAYCPHLGANLGIGGTIVGESVQCPFHGWVFNENGKCTHVPGVESTVNASLKQYTILEVNGFICIWHHSNGNEPDWYPEDHDELKHEMIYRGKSVNEIYCHIQEIYENGADFNHLEPVHGPPAILGDYILEKPPFAEQIVKVFHYDFTPLWKTGTDDDKQSSYNIFTVRLKLFSIDLTSVEGCAQFMGPALGWTKYKMNFLGKREFCITEALIQKRSMQLSFTHKVHSPPGLLNMIIARFLIFFTGKSILRDSIIWSNKKYLPHPMLAKNEKPLVGFRRWVKQFN